MITAQHLTKYVTRYVTRYVTKCLARPLTESLAPAACLLLTGAATLTGCSQSPAAKPALMVSGAYLPQPPMADMAAGYFTVANTGKAADELTRVTSDLASDISMNTTTQAGQMQDAASLRIPAGGKLVLSTGGDHLMLMGLRKMPLVGDKVSFELHFAKSSPIAVQVPVEPATYQPPED